MQLSALRIRPCSMVCARPQRRGHPRRIIRCHTPFAGSYLNCRHYPIASRRAECRRMKQFDGFAIARQNSEVAHTNLSQRHLAEGPASPNASRCKPSALRTFRKNSKSVCSTEGLAKQIRPSCCSASKPLTSAHMKSSVTYHRSRSWRWRFYALPEHSLMSLHYLLFSLFVRLVMRLLFRIVAIATVPAWLGLHVNSAAAQSFNERWSIIPKAHAEPAPEAPDQTKRSSPEQSQVGGQPTRPSDDRVTRQSSNRTFSGKTSYYAYTKGKTASGSTFSRDALTAAHRSLPFGTRVRVTDPMSSRSVVVRIIDRGPWVRGRILDLSLGAARTLGITDRGVAQVRVEVL
ncbi:septal ring lytic transglycosylase RlpA family protein [Bradyrhizobium sp. LMTR 3]|uniref:septal ring lytic transglycosylase RlpA family protein n=1 Tax=Bradyrhizobium sp. LMTR 3 TaxID=189873 RepID=UPI000A072E3F